MVPFNRISGLVQARTRDRPRQGDEFVGARRERSGRRRLAITRHDEPDLSELWKIDPDALEFLARHGPVAVGRIGEQDLVAQDAAKDHKVIVAEGAHRHDDRGKLNEIVHIELAVADTLLAAAIHEQLHVEQRKPLPDTYEFGIFDVLLTP